MAIWQFEFNIVHKSKLNITVSEDTFDEVISWQTYEIDEDSLKRLESKLAIQESWSSKIVQYGNKDGYNLEFYYETNELVEILCRLDLRNIQKQEFEEIYNFIKINDALILYDNKIYKLSKNVFIELITNSKAYKFCKNPMEFIRQLSDKSFT